MIYDFLFYKGYQLGKWSKNFEDIPILAGVIWVGMCYMFNIFSLSFLIEGLGLANNLSFDSRYKYFFSISLVLLLILYYSLNGKHKKIIEKYEEKERNSGKGWHPVIVIAIYYVVSVGLLFLSGMYRNGDL